MNKKEYPNIHNLRKSQCLTLVQTEQAAGRSLAGLACGYHHIEKNWILHPNGSQLRGEPEDLDASL